MPFDTPITTDDASLRKVLAQREPVLLVLVDGSQVDKALDDALRQAAKTRAGDLLVVRVDAKTSPDTYASYGSPALPALVALTKGPAGRGVKSTAEHVQPGDVRAHIDHLLNDSPLAPEKPTSAAAQNVDGKAAAGKRAWKVSDASFQKDVLMSRVPVLVDFWAPWCGPCQTIAPFIDQVAIKYGPRIRVVKMNVDENPNTTRRFNIAAIPTFMVFHNGNPVGRVAGANPAGIQQMIEDALAIE